MRGAVFLGPRKRRKCAGGVSHPSDLADTEAATRQSRQWHAAQKVTRAGNEWVAADRREHAELYVCYISAVAEEERAAAEVERMVNRCAPVAGRADPLGEGTVRRRLA